MARYASPAEFRRKMAELRNPTPDRSATRKPVGTPEINREFVMQNFGIKVRGSEVEIKCPIHGDRSPAGRPEPWSSWPGR
jgi:hypothetical protein